MEVWKEIKDFPNYQISNLGNVKNIKSNNILKQATVVKNEGRYLCYEVIIYNTSRKIGFHKKIHRLVAEAFIPNPENKTDVDHIDGNTSNNNLTNLRWATRSENLQNTNNRSKYTNITKKVNISLMNDGRYKVQVRNKHVGIYNTLDEAQKGRENYLNGIIEAPISKKSEYGKYIYYRKNDDCYAIKIKTKVCDYFKRFKTLEQAVVARDEYLRNNNLS